MPSRSDKRHYWRDNNPEVNSDAIASKRWDTRRNRGCCSSCLEHCWLCPASLVPGGLLSLGVVTASTCVFKTKGKTRCTNIDRKLLLTDVNCPVNLELKQTYLLAGQVVDAIDGSGKVMWITSCDVVVPWKTVSSEQHKRLRNGDPFEYCEDNPCNTGEICSHTDTEECYTCQCPAGYEGPNCEQNIDDCTPDPCENGGICNDGVNSYTCSCLIGFDGDRCENNIDDCTPDPCENGGTCNDGVNSYTCSCLIGFDGDRCENNIDDCTPDPCENGGTCNDGVNSYTCSCLIGFDGDRCENNIDDCTPDPCENGGTCIDGVNSYTCSCLIGFDGERCENNIDDCTPDPCGNGGICNDGVNSYTCSCLDGFDGERCENNIDDCTPDPCENDGICNDGVNSYTCNCLDGFDGERCENNIDDCQPNPCQNGGQCTDGVNSFTCSCATGFEGPFCENNIDDCTPDPCENDGICNDGVNSYTCSCVEGFDGERCENNIDDCAGISCLHDGFCVDLINEYACECLPAYEGSLCEDLSCFGGWYKAYEHDETGAIEGTVQHLIDELYDGADFKVYIPEWDILTTTQSTELIEKNGATGLCSQAIFNLRLDGFVFTSDAFFSRLILCTTGYVNEVQWKIGNNTYDTYAELNLRLQWFVRPTRGSIHSYSETATIDGSTSNVVEATKLGSDLRIKSPVTYVTKLDSVEISETDDKASGQSVKSFRKIHSSVRPTIEFYFGAVLHFRQWLDPDATYTVSYCRTSSQRCWTLDSETVPMKWFADGCWERAYSHDGIAVTDGTLANLKSAILSGKRVRVMLNRVLYETDGVVVKGDVVSAFILGSMSKSDIETISTEGTWKWLAVTSPGTVTTLIVETGTKTVRQRTVSTEAMDWFVQTVSWSHVLRNDKYGAVVQGSKSNLIDDVRNGADVRVLLNLSPSEFYVFTADNVKIGQTIDPAAMLVRSVGYVALSDPSDAFTFDSEPSPYWMFLLARTDGTVGISKWTVNEDDSRGNDDITSAMSWFTYIYDGPS